MANPGAGRSQRNNAVPSYIDNNASSTSGKHPQYTSKSQEKPSLRQANLPDMRQPPPQPKDESVAPESAAEQSIKDVSPELIAAITERVKKELVEHLKQSANAEDDRKTTRLPAAIADPVKKPEKSATVEDEPEAPALERELSNKSQSSTSSPPPTARRVYTPPSPTQTPRATNAPPTQSELSRSPPRSPSEKPSGVRFSDRPLPRPGAGRTFSNMELSTIDQKWGRLFDSEGNPTKRLGQFLRGLANHIVEEFPSKKSIVITPSKMASYYSDYPVDNETHPLVSIFRAQSNEQISRLYQDLGCEHHLVQDHPSDAPIVPALTPIGFAHWMTMHIMAYPEAEAKRLEKVVLALPIDADGVSLDGKPERLPKQISRHLLPQKEDRKSRRWIEDAVSDFFNDLGTSRRQKSTITSSSPPRRSPSTQSRSRPVDIHQVKTAPITISTKPVEREPRPDIRTPSVSESSGNEEPVKIERERQPYTAQPGSGKIYTENSSLNKPSRLERTNSTRESREIRERSEMRRPRTLSTASQNYAPLPRPTRPPNSPTLKGYSSSTPDDLGGYPFIPSLNSAPSSFNSQTQQFGPSSLGYTGSMPPPPLVDRDRIAKEDRRARRATVDEARMVAQFNSPRDAERWDRMVESRSAKSDKKEGRSPVIVDPRNANAEDWSKIRGRLLGKRSTNFKMQHDVFL